MNEYGWIEFPYALDAGEFMNAVEVTTAQTCIRSETEFHGGPLEKMIKQLPCGDTLLDLGTRLFWAAGHDFDGVEHRPFVFSLCIEFPNSDIPLLTERIMQFNASERGSAYREEGGVT